MRLMTRKSSVPAIRKMTVLMVDIRVTAGAALGGLEQTVENLQESRWFGGFARPSHDALQVMAHERSDLLTAG